MYCNIIKIFDQNATYSNINIDMVRNTRTLSMVPTFWRIECHVRFVGRFISHYFAPFELEIPL